ETLGDRLEVGEEATEPALVDEGLAHARGLLGEDLLRLLLRADEEDGAAVRDRLLDEVVGLVDVRQRLLQVDDVDAAALGEDEALDLRVPPTGLVSEVHAAVEQLADGDDGHGRSPGSGAGRRLRLSSRSIDRRSWCPAHSHRLLRDGPEGVDAATSVTRTSIALGTRSHPGIEVRLQCTGSPAASRPAQPALSRASPPLADRVRRGRTTARRISDMGSSRRFLAGA